MNAALVQVDINSHNLPTAHSALDGHGARASGSVSPAQPSHQCLSFLLLQPNSFLLPGQGLHGLGKALFQAGHCLSGKDKHRTEELTETNNVNLKQKDLGVQEKR